MRLNSRFNTEYHYGNRDAVRKLCWMIIGTDETIKVCTYVCRSSCGLAQRNPRKLYHPSFRISPTMRGKVFNLMGTENPYIIVYVLTEKGNTGAIRNEI